MTISKMLVLLLFVGLMLLLDLKNPVGERHRWREYSFLVATVVIGALFGAGVDGLTSRFSPEFFHIGKSIAAGSRFSADVFRYGAQAGASGGVLVAGVLLFLSRESRSALQLFSALPWVASGVVGVGLLFATIEYNVEIFPRSDRVPTLGSEVARKFTTVWAGNCGMYVGAISGMMLFLRKRKLRSIVPDVAGDSDR